MSNNQEIKTKKKKISFFRFFGIFTIFISLVIGIVFSSWSFADGYKLGSDFKGYYSALVAVDNLNSEATTNGQPNGDSEEGAKALNNRLNPMGNNQIIIETAGKNYLKVLSPVDAYENETIFKNQIQRNGGIVLLSGGSTDTPFKDLQITGEGSSITRKGINDYFSSAVSSAVTGSNQKVPAINYDLNGDTFKSLLTAGQTEEQQGSGSLDLTILLDADGFYNDIRNYYNIVSGDDFDQKIEDFYANVLEYFKNIYRSSTDQVVKDALYDLFYGRWIVRTQGSGIEIPQYGSLIAPRSDAKIATADGFKEIANSFTYMSETSKYVYDSNAVTEDFTDENGKYSSNVELYKESSSSSTQPSVRVDKLFNSLNPEMIKFFSDKSQGSIESTFIDHLRSNYFLFSGSVSETESQTSAGYIKDNSLVTKVETYTKAQVGASLFNASGKGFVFTVNSIATLSGQVTNVMLMIGIIFMAIVTICIMIYMIFFYRLLGLFSMVITLAIIGLTLLSTVWFGLTIGPETIISMFIIIALNVEIFSLIFENMKQSVFDKQRGLKTSFNISIKENLGLVLDLVVSLIIPGICMFWLSSNAIRSMAIVLSMGSLFTLAFSMIIGMIAFKIIVNAKFFTKNIKLFALDTSFSKEGNFLLTYKISKIKNKIQKLNSKDLNNKVKPLEEKLLSLNNKLEIIKDKKLKKLELKNNKIQQKLTLKIEKLNKKISILDSEKNANKIQKLNFRINEINYLLTDQTQEIIEAESIIVTSKQEKVKVKTVEKNIYHGLKTISIFGIIMILLSVGISFIFGMNFDYTFGGRTDYTFWGETVDNFYNEMDTFAEDEDAINQNPDLKPLYDYANVLIDEVNNLPIGTSDTDKTLKRTESVYKFIDLSFSNDIYLNYFATASNVKSYQKHKFSVSFGENYNFSSSANQSSNIANWITLTVYTTDNNQSAFVKRYFTTFGVSKDTEITSVNGFISKRIRPATMQWALIEIGYSLLAIILALIIYILIRFKWTYYIAMVVAIVLAPTITAAIIITLQIPLGNSAIIGIVATIVFASVSAFVIFGKARSFISSRNEKSLINFFKKEIEILNDIKLAKKRIKDELFFARSDLKLLFKSNDFDLAEKRKKILDFRELRHQKKLEYKNIKKENKIKINRVSKENNYLSEVLVETFRFGVKRSILLSVFYISIALLISFAIAPIISFGITTAVGVLIANLVILFVALPIWIVFEQIRIRNHLARKRFINSLKVTNEEQIIEGIND
ncbi:protein translocase SecDF, variant type [Spiroplasma taiwanense]|uniref:Bifunctional preprotein translocase subunit SecD/SecF n=1 Tax=Spiroplasma taiwanense CT-1 TaxID=1276220 RepID=S5LZC3_9MOLU|nr:protein translocase SecDF, variant type [Spiroplasma taiwanense]AGR41057.1 bifunctional preprotein translocase subunit SecD/SecF [Spiroplasma taiwanense CT-1]